MRRIRPMRACMLHGMTFLPPLEAAWCALALRPSVPGASLRPSAPGAGLPVTRGQAPARKTPASDAPSVRGDLLPDPVAKSAVSLPFSQPPVVA